ncbi:MAG: SxtJ family membrane protein [Acidobacteriota bacterium]|nr:SxtJ family membrane protein [Acidobacteriota bacterium]
MIDINWKPTDRQLREFAVAFLVAAGLVGGLLWWRLGDNRISPVLWVLGPIVALVGLAAPRSIRWLFLGLTLAAFPIGMVIGFVLLSLTYYLVVTPIGLFFRLLRRDLLDRSIDRGAASYWVTRSPRPQPGRYFRQF